MHVRTALLPLATLVAPAAIAQTDLHTFVETETDAQAGAAVAIWADLDDDGFREWAVGAPGQDSNGVDAGRVTILSGDDYSVVHTFDGAVAGARLGTSVANAGDVDMDGVDDLVIGADTERAVYVYSGADMSLAWSVAEAGEPRFGFAAAAAGDVDDDGFDDVVVGAYGDGIQNQGKVFVYDGEDGSELFSYTDPDFETLGWSVASAGDVNGDGFDDVVAGAPYTDQVMGAEGGALVLAGPNGTVLKKHLPTHTDFRGQELGYSVAPAGDVDGDGFDDYALGARWYGWIHYIDDNWVGVFSGATHNEIWRAEGVSDAWFGFSLANAGDVDKDGKDELLVGDPATGDVYVFSPARDLELFKIDGPSGHGTAVAGGPDVNGDGWPDFVRGASLAGLYSPDAGEATLFTYGCWPDAYYNYCEAAPNSAGPGAVMSAQNSTSIATNNFRLVATGAPPNQLSLFLCSQNQNQVPAGNGFFCLGGPFYRHYPASPTAGGGTPTKQLDFTDPPAAAAEILPGSTWNFINWYRDPPAGGAGFNFSDGLMVTFCP